MKEMIEYSDFLKINIRVGTIIDVKDFPEARKPAFQIFIDFGKDIGKRKSSAQITGNYKKEDLMGRQISAVINFPKKQIGSFMSECLILGYEDESGDIVLSVPDKKIPNGSHLH